MPFDAEAPKTSRDLLILQRARDIVQKGWCQHALKDEHGNHCFLGALNKARNVTGNGDIVALWDAIGDDPIVMVGWNNDPTRTQAEVVARFDLAISRLAVMEPSR